jgi:tetratricopeptide (TPR) repeat protein
MQKLSNILLIVLLLAAGGHAYAQPVTDEQLAGQYFNDGEFDKATLYYERLYAGNPSDHFYSFLFACYLETGRFDDGEKLIKKHSKRVGAHERFTIHSGLLQEALGNPEKALARYNEAIESLPDNYYRITALGNQFLELGKPELALKTYERGEKLVRNHPFNMEKASVYGAMGEWQLMITTYFDLLDLNDAHMISIQQLLGKHVDFANPENEKVQFHKAELLRRIQKNPGKTVYTEMLIWHFIQCQDFEAALTQAKALDKRRGSEGMDVLNLALMCASNNDYVTAIAGYEYVIAQYPNGPYAFQAKMEMLSTLYTKITSSSYTAEEVNKLATMYNEALSLQGLGKNKSTVRLMRELASIKGYYQADAAGAIKVLEEARSIPGLGKNLLAEMKLELADLMLLSGEIWEASLLYMQVEKEFKEDILGHEAKFRNARVFYYSGSFDYARAQLDVLKASTSKLIANDALDLSLLIMDNLAFDTSLRALQLYAQAELMIFQNRFDVANDYLDTIENQFTGHTLTDEVLYKRFEIAQKKRDCTDAVKHLKKIVQNHPHDILIDDALFNLGEIYQFQFRDLKEAAEYYRKIIFEHSGSLYVVEARKRFREITEKSPELLAPQFDPKIFEPWPENPEPGWLFEKGIDRKQYEELRKKHGPGNQNP